MNTDCIVIKNIVKHYPRLTEKEELLVLDHISIGFPKGKFISVVGESGCGKTTLLRMIAGFEFPSEGFIEINGAPVTGPTADCGMLFQQDVLFPWLTVKGNVAFGPKMLCQLAKKRDYIDSLLKMVHIHEFANDYPAQLSGGMKQRVSLARALANDPAVLLLDEPLGALDAFTRMHIQGELLAIRKIASNTMVMVTHDIDEAVYLSDVVVVMTPRPGRIKDIIFVEMSHPRNRSSVDFVNIRNRILEMLHYAVE
jgi:ABC-type nitrate/sulfonate/bicarbonate transport system ATPase subunit